MRTNQKGFTLVEVLLVVIVIGILGVIGWRVWEANMGTPIADQSIVLPSKIKNEADLDKSITTLDSTDVVGDSEQQLEAETNF